jgi:hypothetical protein
MIISLPLLILLFVIMIYPARNHARKLNAWFVWDYGYPFYTILIWSLVSGIGGIATMSNMVVEIPISYLIVLTIVYFRIFVLAACTKNARTLSLITLIITLPIPIIVRLLMPTLDE